MPIVRISDMTEEEKKKWLEQKKQRENKIEINRIDETNLGNRLFNEQTKLVETPEKSNDDTWFTAGAFKDGYQFGDVSKTAAGTVGDIASNAVHGVMNIGEGIGDLIQYGVAGIKDWTGDEEGADALREKAKFDSVGSLFEHGDKYLDENSLLGEKSDNIVQGLGYVAGMTAVSMATAGAGSAIGVSGEAAATAGSTATIFSSSMGQGMTQAYQEGANDDEAWKYGVISGLAEAGSELMFGGLGKATGAIGLSKGVIPIDDVIAKKVSGVFKSTLAKNLSEYAIKAGAEGTEEVVSGFIQALGQKLTYKSDEEIGKLIKDQDLMEQFVAGAITSAMAQLPGQNGIIKTTKNGRDFVSGLTNNETKIYDNELSTRVNEQTKTKAIENAYNEQVKVQENLGVKLTEEEKGIIKQAVTEAYESGKIQDNTKLDSKEYSALEEQVKKDLEEGNISTKKIREIIGENTNIKKDLLLQRSYYEEAQRYESYKIEKTDNEKINKLYQSAVDSGFDNTTKTRKKVELISKLTSDTDMQYKFISPEQLKEKGYNENANGLIDKSTGDILINSLSNKSVEAVVGHETTHIFDTKAKDATGKTTYSKEYEALQNTVIEYAKEKGIYEDKVKSITNAYGNLIQNESQIKEELTADLVGDFLFNDETFIQNLSTNKNVFQKIYEYVKHAYKMATAGTEEAKKLEDLKYKFDKVYQTLGNQNTNTTEGVKYSLPTTDNQGRTLSKEQQENINTYSKENLTLTKSNYNKPAKEGTIRLYTNTKSTNIDSILKEGLLVDKSKQVEYEGNMTWFETRPDLKGYGGTTIAVDVPLNTLMDKVNDTQYTVFDNIKPENIVFVDKPVFNNYRTSDLQKLVNKYGENKVLEVFNKSNNKSVELNEFKEMLKSIVENPDIRYSLSESGKLVDNTTGKEEIFKAEETGDNKDLLAIHNLTEDKLKGVLELGGFPSPSIAVTKDVSSNAQYGGISIVFDKNTIDPQLNNNNKVYSRDAYTPRVPETVNKLNSKGLTEVANKLNMSPSMLEANEFKNTTLEKAVENVKRKEEVINKYLEDNNIKVDDVYTPYKTRSGISVEGLEEFINNVYDNDHYNISTEDLVNKYSEPIKKSLINDLVKDLQNSNTGKSIEELTNTATKLYDDIGFNKIDRYLTDADNYIKNGKVKNVIDNRATLDVKKSKIDFDSDEYNQYVKDLISPAFEKEKYIRNNKDYYTNSGNPRSFNQLYNEYTLDNIVSIMKELNDTGSESNMFVGIPEIAANASKRFKSIEDIKNNENMLTTIGDEEYTNITNEYASKLLKLSEEAIKRKNLGSNNYFSLNDSYASSIGEIAKKMSEGKNVTTKGIISTMKKNYFDVTETEAKQIKTFLSELQSLPTNYFEAKPQRAVGLDEVQAVVIPNNTDINLKQQLSDKGLNIVEYDPNIEGDRQSKINSLDNLKFSLTNDTPITGDDIAVKDLQKLPTIENEVGTQTTIETPTVEDVLNQTPEEKQQGMKDKAQKYLSRSKTQFMNKIVNDFGTSKIANTKTLNNVVDSIRADIQENGSLSKEQADTYFNDLYNSLVKIDTEYYDTYKDVKDKIRKTKLYVSDSIRNDMTDFNEFRKRNMGTIIMSNDSNNIAVNSYYQELNEMYPELFPSEISNATEQLERISEITKDIAKVETNVSAYNDQYMGEEYRDWARNEFDKDINDFTQDIKLADRYNNDVKTKADYGADLDSARVAYEQIPAAKKSYEKALSKELLTEEDKVQVDRLLNGEIQAQDIPAGLNKKGIMNVANAKYEYDTLQKICKDYSNKVKTERIELVKEVFGNPDEWTDKKTGVAYSTETALRNIVDTAPSKEVADNVNNTFFRPITEVSETERVKFLNKLYSEVEAFKIGTKNKYKVTYQIEKDGKKEIVTNKVSESALIQLLGEHKITSKDVELSGANVDKIQGVVDYARQTYNSIFKQLNETRLRNGYAPVEYRKDYFPHFTETTPDNFIAQIAKEMNFDISDKQELPTSINGNTENFKPGTTWFGNILRRNTDETVNDFLKGFELYTKGVSNIIYHTDNIQNLRAIGNVVRKTYDNTEFQNKLLEIKESNMTDLEKNDAINELREHMENNTNLGNFVKWLDNYTNLLANKKSKSDRLIEDFLNRHFYTIAKQYESRTSANAIGGNVSVALTNFAPIAQALGETNPLYMAEGTWKTMQDIARQDTSFSDKCDFYIRRQGVDNLNETILDKVTKPINKVLNFADDFTSQVLLRSKYIQNLHEGMNTEEAITNANRYTASLMADRSKGALPTVFNNQNPVSKLFNMFQVEVNNQWRYYTKDLPQNMQEKANGNKAKFVADTAMAYTKIMVGSYLFNELIGQIRGNATRVLPDPIYIIKELIKGLGDDDKDNDDETFISAVAEIAGNVPFISVPAKLLGDSFGFDTKDIGRVSISSAIPNVKDITTDVIDMINGNKTVEEGVGNIGQELASTVGAYTILPYGGSQIKKTITGLDMFNNEVPGNYTDSGDLRYTVDDSVGSKVQAGLFGAYANPYATDYINSGYKAIKQDNINEMVGLDMNSTEYREYRQGLNASTKTEDKLNYINSLDLTPSQKTLAANNINKNSKTTIDMFEYNNYNSYDEYKYARDNPEKYSTISQISDYDSYNTYNKAISNIKEQYSTEKGYTSNERKILVQQYIESLPLNAAQKMMLEKEAGGYSIKNYTNQIKEYLDSLDISQSEKSTIWNELFK